MARTVDLARGKRERITSTPVFRLGEEERVERTEVGIREVWRRW